MAYELIETIEVGAGGAASIEFTSIPQDGVDLLLVFSGRVDSTDTPINIQLNSDTGSNYTYVRLLGTGSNAVSSTTTTTQILGGYVPSSSYTANTFGNAQIYFSNYISSDAKSISVDAVSENNATLAYQLLNAQTWSGTAAITSMLIFPNASHNWVQYSTASLYKIS